MAFARIEGEIPGQGYQVLVHEGFPFFITADVFRAQHLSVGQELTEEQCSELKAFQQKRNCYSQAMVYLARREHTALELTQKLVQKGYELQIIKPTLEQLAEENLLSEYRYALLTIEHRQKKSPEGRVLMAQRLAAKGVTREDAQRALDELYDEESIVEYVQKAYLQVVKKVGEDKVRYHLQKKGFSSYEIRLGLEGFEKSE